jgi:hypothetical protein
MMHSDRAAQRRAHPVHLFAVTLGDRHRRGRGIMLSVNGAVRALVTPRPDGEIVHAFACDTRVAPIGGMMVFRDLSDALAWFAPRLGAAVPGDDTLGLAMPWRRRSGRALDDTPSWAEVEAREAFLRCADRYCLLMRGRGDPGGPLHELLATWAVWRKIFALRVERDRERRADEDEFAE